MKLLNDRENEYPLVRQKNIIKLKIFSVLALLTLSLGMATGEGKKASLIELAQQSKPVEGDWEYTSFSAEGLDPTRFELLKERIQDNTFRRVDGVVVVKSGKILIEQYFNGYDRDRLHEIRSATKSIGSALLGIAIDQDYITGIQDKLYTYFRERQPFLNWDEGKDKITLENVLNMTTGLDCNDFDSSSEGNESNVIQATDIVQFMLDLPVVYEPGEQWAYSTGSAHLIGAVIESAAGISVQEFAKIYLFEPLDITQYEWNTTGGIAHTGGGFWMRPIDMAKFGQLYLNKGRWQGKQIISEEWTNEARKIHTKVTNDLGYGHLWWKWIFKIDEQPFPAFSAQGSGENHIFVLPDLELVVVLTGSAYNESYGPAQTVMMMSQYILPAVVQDLDSHRNKPDLRILPKALFALCAVLFISALLLWPIGFIMRRIRVRRSKDSDSRRARLWPGIARILSGLGALTILCSLALFLSDAHLFNLLLNSGMSHPLGIFEIFLGTSFITIVAAVVWFIVLLAVIQAVFMVLAHRNKWWTPWQRWHFTVITLASCYFVIVILLWGFGKIPS
jgi:CubicO group peptidase (beta-lactamase class C family)